MTITIPHDPEIKSVRCTCGGAATSLPNQVSPPHVQRTLQIFKAYPVVGGLYYFFFGFCVDPVGFWSIGNGICIPLMCFCCVQRSINKTLDGRQPKAAARKARCCICWFSFCGVYVFCTAIIGIVAAISSLSALPLVCNLSLAAELAGEEASPIIVEDAVPWLHAEKACLEQGRHLITFCDEAEWTQFFAHKKPTPPKWIGYTDRNFMGNNYMGNNTNENYTDWAPVVDWTERCGQGKKPFFAWYPGEPNNFDGEDCAQIHSSNSTTWNDFKCEPVLGFAGYICGAQPCGMTKTDKSATLGLEDKFRTTATLRFVFQVLVSFPVVIFYFLGVRTMRLWVHEDISAVAKPGAVAVGGPVAAGGTEKKDSSLEGGRDDHVEMQDAAAASSYDPARTAVTVGVPWS